ncbi:MAG: MalY/PatB family protein [Candidatus Hermodarchaeota archaeon]
MTQAIIRRAKHRVFGYSYLSHEYYDAVINWFKRRHSWTIEKNWIFFTPGVLPGLSFSIQAFSEPGDKILLQTPAYPPFFSVIRTNSRSRLLNPLKLIDGRYEIDFKDLRKKVKDPKARFLILCNPHNPSGRVWTKKELTTLGEICLDNQILVISDEIHCDFVYPNNKHIPFASICNEFAQNSITCTSPSKSFNIPSLKVANIIIPNSKLRNSFSKIRQQNHITEPNCFASTALEAAYNECEGWLDDVIKYIQTNLEFLKDYIKKKLPEIKVIEPEGTYLVWLDFRKLGFSVNELSNVLFDKAKVALFEGWLFGRNGRGFERINIACPRSTLKQALDQIFNVIKALKKK